MYLDYSKLKLDSFGRPEVPDLELQTLDGRSIGTIPYVSKLKFHLKFSELSEMEFEIPRKTDGALNPLYDSVSGYKLISTQTYGVYVVMDPVEESDGISETKTVTCYSREKLLDTKRFYISEGTYNFYNPASPADTLLGMIMECAVGWKVGYVSPSLWGRYRTFDDYDDNLLSFMYGTANEKYRCVFVFDTYEMTVNVYDADEERPALPIYLDFDNLVQNVKVNEISDELITAMRPYGADELDIRNVNPIGTNWIYDLTYFIENGSIETELADKWQAWQNKIDEERSRYTGLIGMQASTNAKLLTERAKLTDLEGELTDLKNQQSVNIQQQAQYPDDDDIADLVTQSYQDVKAKEAEIDAQEEVIANLEALVNSEIVGSYSYQIQQIVNELKFTAYFSEAEQEALSHYFIEQDLTEETFVATNLDTSVSGKSTTLSNSSVNVDMSNVSVVEVKIGDETSGTVYSMDGGTLSIAGDTVISCDIVRGTLEVDSTGTFVMSAYATGAIGGEGEEVLPETTVTIEGGEADLGDFEQPLTPGQTYIVSLDAQKYECMCYGENNNYYLGNGQLESEETLSHTSSEPFCINMHTVEGSGTEYAVYIPPDTAAHTDVVPATDILWRVNGYEFDSTTGLYTILSTSQVTAKNLGSGMLFLDISVSPSEQLDYLYRCVDATVNTIRNYDDEGNVISIEQEVEYSFVVVRSVATVYDTAYCKLFVTDDRETSCIRIIEKTEDYSNTTGVTITLTGQCADLVADTTAHTIDTGLDDVVYDVVATSIAFNVSSGTMYVTAEANEYKKYLVQLELLDFATLALAEAATPTYEFSVDSGNFIFAKEFEPFKDKMELGKGIYLRLSPDLVISPIAIEMELDFEDRAEFSLVFSNRFKRHDNVATLKDMLEKSYSTSRSVDTSKYIYGQAANQVSNVTKFLNSSLDAAVNTIKSSANQSITIDGAGIHLAGDGKYQMRLVDKMIAMTDDGWQSAKLAIGLFSGDEIGEYWGVNADVIGGKLLVGNNLIIENSTDDGVMQFRVDASGAWLNNASFVMQGSGGQLMIDPTYGVVAGPSNIYTTSGTTITPAFLDENGKIVFEDDDDNTQPHVPKGTNFYMDPTDGSVYLRGTIYATDGVFSGKLSAATGTFSGELSAATGTFSGELSAASGTFSGEITASEISGGTIDGADITGGSLNIGSGNYIVDSSGNVTMNGNIVLGGSISWSSTNSPVLVLYARKALSKPTSSYSSYPSSSSTGWHKTMNETYDLYASYSYDGGASWTEAVKIQGTDGIDGEDGSDANIPDYITLKGIDCTLIDGVSVSAPSIYGGVIAGADIYGGTFNDLDEIGRLELNYRSIWPAMIFSASEDADGNYEDVFAIHSLGSSTYSTTNLNGATMSGTYMAAAMGFGGSWTWSMDGYYQPPGDVAGNGELEAIVRYKGKHIFTQNAVFEGYADFTDANVTGLSVVATFG